MQQGAGKPAPIDEVAVMDKAVDKAVGGNKKRTKKFVVRQEYIDLLLKRYPFKPYPWDPEVLEKNLPHREIREQFLAMIPSVIANMKAERDRDEDIVRQYFAKGYAEEEVEVDDDGDEEAS